jgi:hypothetical protein
MSMRSMYASSSSAFSAFTLSFHSLRLLLLRPRPHSVAQLEHAVLLRAVPSEERTPCAQMLASCSRCFTFTHRSLLPSESLRITRCQPSESAEVLPVECRKRSMAEVLGDLTVQSTLLLAQAEGLEVQTFLAHEQESWSWRRE